MQISLALSITGGGRTSQTAYYLLYWILRTGSWDDTGFWSDAATWNDGA